MRLLAIDTSSELCALAIVAGDVPLASLHTRLGVRHAEALFPLIAQLCTLSGIERTALEAIAVGIGPGSFTGTRIGLAAGKGIALALDVPLVGVSSALAVALAAPGTRIATILDAHKGEVYAAVYARQSDRMREVVAPFSSGPNDVVARLGSLEGLVAVGAGMRRYPSIALPVLPALFDAPNAVAIAHEAIARLREGTADDRAALEPLYVRGSDAKLPEPR